MFDFLLEDNMKPVLLLIPLGMLGLALLWFGIYEIFGLAGKVPTISSYMRPIIQSHLVASVFILMLLLGFAAGLVYDWYISKGG